jgi:hypothetical protein
MEVKGREIGPDDAEAALDRPSLYELAKPLKSLERLHSAPRPVPDCRRRDRTETRRGRNGR